MEGNLTITMSKDGEREVIWHYHAIGIGTIFHYNIKSMEISMTCQHTGQLISSQSFHKQGGISKEIFVELCKFSYEDAIQEGTTLDLDYMEDPTIVGCVGIDFNLIKN